MTARFGKLPRRSGQASAMLPGPLDVTLAFKALSLCPDLSVTARRVGATLVDHFNRRTGQCDPSQGRIARLLENDISSVKRGVKELCESTDVRSALFTRISHGGGYAKCAYQPLWPVFREIAAAWDAAKGGDHANGAATKVAVLPPDSGQLCNGSGGNFERQTIRTKKNYKSSPSSERKSKALSGSATGFGKKGCQNSPNHSDVFNNIIEDRINNEMLSVFDEIEYAEIVEFLNTETYEKAILAEKKQSGAGIIFIVNAYEKR